MPEGGGAAIPGGGPAVVGQPGGPSGHLRFPVPALRPARVAVTRWLDGDPGAVAGRFTFAIDEPTADYLARVGWSREAVDVVRERLDGTPQGRRYVLRRFVPLVGGLLSGVLLATAGSVAAAVYGDLWLGVALVAAATAVVSAAFVADNRFLVHHAEARVIGQLIRVLTAAREVLDDFADGDRHRALAGQVRKAAWRFERAYRGKELRPSATGRLINRRAGLCAEVLRSYAPTAALGDDAAVIRLREDMARAVLRAGTGYWPQVAELRPDIVASPGLRIRLPRVTGKEVVAVAVPAIGLVTALLTKGAGS